MRRRPATVSSCDEPAGGDLRHGLFEDVVGSVSWPVVFLVEHPGGALVQALQLLVLSVLQDLRHVSQDAVHLRSTSVRANVSNVLETEL